MPSSLAAGASPPVRRPGSGAALGASAPLWAAGWDACKYSCEFPLLLKLVFPPLRVSSEMRCEGMLNVSAVSALNFSLLTMPALLEPETESPLSGVKM